MNFGNGTLWKYAQTVGPAYLGAPTHPGGKKKLKLRRYLMKIRPVIFVVVLELDFGQILKIIKQNNLLILVIGLYLEKLLRE